MIIMAVIPAVLQIIGMLYVPESPRFLYRAGRVDEALGVLRRIRGGEAQAQRELSEIRLILEEEGAVTWTEGALRQRSSEPSLRPSLPARPQCSARATTARFWPASAWLC